MSFEIDWESELKVLAMVTRRSLETKVRVKDRELLDNLPSSEIMVQKLQKLLLSFLRGDDWVEMKRKEVREAGCNTDASLTEAVAESRRMVEILNLEKAAMRTQHAEYKSIAEKEIKTLRRELELRREELTGRSSDPATVGFVRDEMKRLKNSLLDIAQVMQKNSQMKEEEMKQAGGSGLKLAVGQINRKVDEGLKLMQENAKQLGGIINALYGYYDNGLQETNAEPTNSSTTTSPNSNGMYSLTDPMFSDTSKFTTVAGNSSNFDLILSTSDQHTLSPTKPLKRARVVPKKVYKKAKTVVKQEEFDKQQLGVVHRVEEEIPKSFEGLNAILARNLSHMQIAGMFIDWGRFW